MDEMVFKTKPIQVYTKTYDINGLTDEDIKRINKIHKIYAELAEKKLRDSLEKAVKDYERYKELPTVGDIIKDLNIWDK